MKNKGQGYLDFSETKPWNVAEDYSQLKIMKLLYELDQYELMATYGVVNIAEEFAVDPEVKKQMRISAVKRLAKTCQMVINNTIFMVKKKDKPRMEALRQDVEKVKPLIKMCYSNARDEKSKGKNIIIHEEMFEKLLDILIRVKTDLVDPLNEAKLIYTKEEDFDIDKYKQNVMNQIVEGG